MKTTKIEDAKVRLKHYESLRSAGVDVPGTNTGPPVILWTKDWAEEEAWEVLPEFFADLALVDFAQTGKVARAAIYHKPPSRTPLSVVREWAAQYFEKKDGEVKF